MNKSRAVRRTQVQQSRCFWFSNRTSWMVSAVPCFQCRFGPIVKGVKGLDAYKSMFQSNTMSAPTEFEQEVSQAGGVRAMYYDDIMTSHTKGAGMHFMLLLIVKDGVAKTFDKRQRKLNVYRSMPQ